ncbi:hypothetical protein BD309DRAFT_1085273 [Dichomitus squalens]|nr:hypothetical protein BD309DRAFT_1085273 [Dichomitus squalens]
MREGSRAGVCHRAGPLRLSTIGPLTGKWNACRSVRIVVGTGLRSHVRPQSGTYCEAQLGGPEIRRHGCRYAYRPRRRRVPPPSERSMIARNVGP